MGQLERCYGKHKINTEHYKSETHILHRKVAFNAKNNILAGEMEQFGKMR